MPLRIKGLREVRALVEGLADTPDLTVSIEVPADAAERIAHLAAGGRDLTATTPTMEAEVAAAASAALEHGTPESAARAGGEAALRRLQRRVDEGGADLNVRPLAASTAQRKGHARPFVDSGALARGLHSARVVVSRG